MDTDIATLFQSCGDGAVDCTNLVDTVRQAGEECAINDSWSSILHVLALSSVLSEPIVSVFPDVPHYARSLYHGVIQPQSTSQNLKVSESRPLIIFWSQYGNPSIARDSPYTTNHVVPLVASEAREQNRHVNEIVQKADDHPSTSVSRPKTKVKSKRAGKTKEQSNLNKQWRISTFFQKDAMISAHTHANIPPPNTARRPDSDERSAQLLINRPSSANTEGEVTRATIPTTNCNEHQGDRKIQSPWLTTYTWLQLEGGMFFCKSGTNANMTNIFTKGKPADLPKKDDMKKHCQSRDHIASLKNVCQKKAFEKAVSNVYDSAKECIMAQLATLFVFFKMLYCQQQTVAHNRSSSAQWCG